MTLDEITKHLIDTRNLKFLKEKTDNVSNKLYLLTENGTTPQYILKGLLPNNFEIEAYSQYLPKTRNTFQTLIIPQVIEQYPSDNIVYLLIPYLNGTTFDFNTPDLGLAKEMPKIVKDLMLINTEEILEGSSNFDFVSHEERFWIFFERAVKLSLIDTSIEGSTRSKANDLLIEGRATQKMIISNGDFNPRNIIRLSGDKLVLIDWNDIVSPLEHHLVYPWLLNYENPSWQKEYAQNFEELISIQSSNVRYHLMTLSIQVGVDEKSHNTPAADRKSGDHMNNFYRSIEGFNSLTEF